MKESNVTPLYARPQSDDDYLDAAHEMQRMGGGFASCIARAYFAADSSNKERLKAAFPDLFTRYFDEYLRNQGT